MIMGNENRLIVGDRKHVNHLFLRSKSVVGNSCTQPTCWVDPLAAAYAGCKITHGSQSRVNGEEIASSDPTGKEKCKS